MDNFWKEISKFCGPVPQNVRVILEQLRFIHAGLARIDDDTIAKIEEEVRSLPITSGRPESEWQKLLEYNAPLKRFRLQMGERSYLKVVADYVSAHGIAKFCKRLLKPETRLASSMSPDEVESVRSKILKFYRRKYVLPSKYYIISKSPIFLDVP